MKQTIDTERLMDEIFRLGDKAMPEFNKVPSSKNIPLSLVGLYISMYWVPKR